MCALLCLSVKELVVGRRVRKAFSRSPTFPRSVQALAFETGTETFGAIGSSGGVMVQWGRGFPCKYACDGCSLVATVPRYLTGPRPAAAATETDNELNSGRKRQMQQNKCEAFSKTQRTICDMRCTATCDHICNRWVHVCGEDEVRLKSERKQR